MRPLLRRVPRLDKRALCAIRRLLGAHFLDTDARAVLRKDDVLLLHFAHTALSELFGVEVNLWSVLVGAYG